MRISASAITLALQAVRSAAAPESVADCLEEVAAREVEDDLTALREALVRRLPERAGAETSPGPAFVPVHCTQCNSLFRAWPEQLGLHVNCPLCEAAIILPEHLLDLRGGALPARRAAEAEPRWETGGPLGSFAHFDLLSFLGSGGAGRVYRARNRRTDRIVALKVLTVLPLETRRRSWGRVVREAKLSAELVHPHVAQIYDLGLADGAPFLEMEYLPGGSLRSRVEQEGPLQWERALEVISQALSGLAAAHRKRIIHRDLKPTNLMLDADGEARITDFGLCKFLEESTSTTTGRVLGSPRYMAPEQWKGEETGPWTDIYAAAMTLHYLLTARPPFDAEETLGLMYQHLHYERPDPRQWNDSVPGAAVEVIKKAAAPEPEARHGSADALREALQRAG